MLGYPHENYLGEVDIGPICVSIMKAERKHYVIIRTPQAEYSVVLGTSSVKELWESLQLYHPYCDRRFLTLWNENNKDLEKDLSEYDEHKQLYQFKCGVLYYSEGQTDEDEIFGNVKGSKYFDKFLTVLGDIVPLKAWPKYAAGLDVEKDQTGKHSIFTTFNNRNKDIEIMYHVSTFLPFIKKDKQQIQRKRHLGNDMVVIVFHDGNTPFSPHTITSKYIQVFIIVRVIDRDLEKPKYKVSVIRRGGVPDFEPALPNPPIFTHDHFREFLLQKLVNAVRASFESPQFKRQLCRTRRLMLQSLVDKYNKKEK